MKRQAALAPLVFVSGASGLIFEIVWIRAAGLQFGTSTPAITTVVSSFMLGLALGNRWLGRAGDRYTRPFILYSQLEMGIGVTGLIVSAVLLRGSAPLSVAAVWLSRLGPIAPAIRFALLFALLAVPTTLMGGTLPVLSRAMVRQGSAGRWIGALYAANTAGAVAGALLPDLALVPRIGLLATCGVAAVGNLCIAVIVGRLYRGDESAPSPEPEPAASGGVEGNDPGWGLGLYAASGFAAMGSEIAWSRLISHWSGGPLVSFSILLATYLLFLALGARIASLWADRPGALDVAASLAVAIAISLFVPVIAGRSVPMAIAQWLEPGRAGWARAPAVDLWISVVGSLYLAAIPALLMGLAMPFIAASLVRTGSAGRWTGLLYALNTVAGVVGAVVAGFVLIPYLGAQRTLWILSLIVGVAGSVVALRRAGGLRLSSAPAAVVTAGLLAAGLLVRADRLLSASFPEWGHLESVVEGPTTTAAVRRHSWAGQPAYSELLTPGVSMSATSLRARRYMGLMGHLPLLFSKERSDAALICFGVGNTARSLLSHASLKRLDVVDISREVLGLSARFSLMPGGDPLRDPRVAVHVDDGRQYLLTTDHRYDVITSEPPPPANAGVVNLYSREYYAIAGATLKPDGVLAQWLPVWELSAEDIRGIVGAFVAEFPHAALFRGQGYQWILIGSHRPLTIGLDDWQTVLSTPAVQQDLTSIGFPGLPDVLATYLLGEEGLQKIARDGDVLTDDLPSIEYPSKAVRDVDLPAGIEEAPDEVLRLAAADSSVGTDPKFKEALARAFQAARWVHVALPLRQLAPPAEKEIVFGSVLWQALAARPGDPQALDLLQIGPDQFEPARASAEKGEDVPEARTTFARRAFYEQDWTATLSWLNRLHGGELDPRVYWLLRGGAERGAGEIEAARKSFEEAARGTSGALAESIARLVNKVAVPLSPGESPIDPR